MHKIPGLLALVLMVVCASCSSEPPPVPPLVVQRIKPDMTRQKVFAKLNGDARLTHQWHHRDLRLWDWEEVELPDGHLDLFFQVRLKEDKDHPLQHVRLTGDYPQYCEQPLNRCQDGCHVCGTKGECQSGGGCANRCGPKPYHLCLPASTTKNPAGGGVERDYVTFYPDAVPRRDEDILIRYQFTNHVGWVMRYGDWPEDGLGVCYYNPSHR